MRATSSSERVDSAPQERERDDAARTVRRYVAMGDSFTAGIEGEEAAGRWPDELAASLRAVEPRLEYHNLAVAGARSDEVARDQLESAVALAPDALTLVCGANDVLLSVRPDLDLYAATFSATLGRLREALPETVILTATTPNFADFLGLHERSRKRVAEGMARLAETTRWVARRHEVTCLEFAETAEAGDRANFATDGYHPSEQANKLAAGAFLAALGDDFEVGSAGS